MKKPELPNVRERKNQGEKSIYFIDYWDPFQEKRIRETVGTRRIDARKRADQIYQQLMARYLGEPTDTATAEITLPELIEAFFRSNEGHLSPASIVRYRIFAKNFEEFFSTHMRTVRSVRKVTRAQLDAHLEEMKNKGHQPKTLNAHLTFLKGLFNYAVVEGCPSSEPFGHISGLAKLRFDEFDMDFQRHRALYHPMTLSLPDGEC